jgi:predicted nucleic acid-binding protein
VRAFFDTNVIVYAHDRRDRSKQGRALALMEQHIGAGSFVLSTQVMIEAYNALHRAVLLKKDMALDIVESLADEHVVPADASLVLRALQLAHRCQLSHWDGLVVQAALDAGCATLYSEDMQAGRRFGELEVVNPFADAAHEPRPAYAARKRAPPVPSPSRKGRRS